MEIEATHVDIALIRVNVYGLGISPRYVLDTDDYSTRSIKVIKSMDVNRLHTVNRTVSHLRAETLVSKRIDNQIQNKSAKAHEVRTHTVNLHL